MPHGAPDWSKYRTSSVTFPVFDLAELAARLNSIVTFDRRGDVVLLEDFSSGMNRWTAILFGVNAAATLSPNYTHSPGYAAELTCGSTAAFRAAISTRIPYPTQPGYGIETAFTLAGLHTAFTLHTSIYDGTTRYFFELYYTPATNTLSYLDDTNNYTALTPTITLYTGTSPFHHLKLVFDPSTRTYTRAILDHQHFPLTSLPCHTGPSGAAPNLFTSIGYYGALATNPIGYLDNIIITQDEP